MGAFDAAVLMGSAAVVARGAHAVVVAQFLVAAGDIVSGGFIEVVVGGRQAVGTVLFRDRTEQPQGVLTAAAQGDEALAAEDHVSVLETRVGQPEVIQQMLKRHTADSDAEVTGGGEVGLTEATGWMPLREDHLLFGAMQGAPPAHAPFEGAAHAWQGASDGGGAALRRWSPRADPGSRPATAPLLSRRCRPVGQNGGCCGASASVTVVVDRTRCGRRWRC